MPFNHAITWIIQHMNGIKWFIIIKKTWLSEELFPISVQYFFTLEINPTILPILLQSHVSWNYGKTSIIWWGLSITAMDPKVQNKTMICTFVLSQNQNLFYFDNKTPSLNFSSFYLSALQEIKLFPTPQSSDPLSWFLIIEIGFTCPSQTLQHLPKSSKNYLECSIPFIIVGDWEVICWSLYLVERHIFFVFCFFTLQSGLSKTSLAPHRNSIITCCLRKLIKMIKT